MFAAETPRPVGVVSTRDDAARKLRYWLSQATVGDHWLYHPHEWNTGVLSRTAVTARKQSGPQIEGALNQLLPGRETVISYAEEPAGTERLTSQLLDVIPRGGTWIGFGPLPLRSARTIARSAAEHGITYVHAPLRDNPGMLPRGHRPLSLVYQDQEACRNSWMHTLLCAVTYRLSWMGPLSPPPVDVVPQTNRQPLPMRRINAPVN